MENFVEMSVVNNAIANGMIKTEVTVKSAMVVQFDTNWQIQLNTYEEVPNWFYNVVDGTESQRLLKMVRLSEIDIMYAIKNDPDLSLLANTIRKQPQLLVGLMEGCKLTILSEKVEKGAAWKNIFAENPKEKVIKKTNILHHVVGLEVGESAKNTIKAFKVQMQQMVIQTALADMFKVTERKAKTVSATAIFADNIDSTDTNTDTTNE